MATIQEKEVKGSTMKVENGHLIIDVPLEKGSPSASRKSIVYFSTHGIVEMNDGYSIGVNLFKKR